MEERSHLSSRHGFLNVLYILDVLIGSADLQWLQIKLTYNSI